MKALINANALTDAVDRNGKTLVFIAAEEDQVHILDVIMQHIHVFTAIHTCNQFIPLVST